MEDNTINTITIYATTSSKSEIVHTPRVCDNNGTPQHTHNNYTPNPTTYLKEIDDYKTDNYNDDGGNVVKQV